MRCVAPDGGFTEPFRLQSSKVLYRELNGSRYVWMRAIRKCIQDECLPPRSLDFQISEADLLPDAHRVVRLREIASRPYRLRNEFYDDNSSASSFPSAFSRSSPTSNVCGTLTISMTFTRFRLTYGRGLTELRRLPVLFPVGKYLLTTGAYDDRIDALFCWDMDDVMKGKGNVLNPIHYIARVDVRSKKDMSGLDIKVQYDPVSRQVVVLAHYCDYPNDHS